MVLSRYAERDGVALGNEARGRNLDIDLEKLARRVLKLVGLVTMLDASGRLVVRTVTSPISLCWLLLAM